MRHGKKFNHLGRKPAHRKAMLSNMACSLIEHKSINTTVAKAKALRKYVEPLLTKSKTDSTHSRRVVFSYLQNKFTVTELFRDVAPKIANRPGGYTRIIRTGYRLGDNAEMCMIELVDFNDIYVNENSKKTTRRSRRGAGGASGATEETVEAVTSTEEVKTEVKAEVVEEAKTETAAEVVEEVKAEPEAVKKEVKADDLKKIEGIGPKIADVLAEAGLVTYADLAASTPEAINEILSAHKTLAGKDPATWCDQAKMAAEGKWDELKKWQDEMDGGKPTE
tara:strand:- start:109404 stop:110240 length:837 start_codon:yes stop_codon:yes gene_type:complete